MYRRIFLIISVIAFALAVLIISILRTASVRYSFLGIYADYADRTDIGKGSEVEDVKVDYFLAYPGTVLPDHPLWYIKALRDKLWLTVTTNKSKKAELNLLFADKRIGSALILFEKGRIDLGYTTLTKAEKYLEESARMEEVLRAAGENTGELSERLTKASLKHRLVIRKIMYTSPEELSPRLEVLDDIAESVYNRESIVLQSYGVTPPKSPF